MSHSKEHLEQMLKDLVEEAGKVWKDIVIYKSEDVPWRVKCQRLVDHVYAVFSFGSENWSWTQQTLEKLKVGKRKTMTKLFRLKKTKRRDVG